MNAIQRYLAEEVAEDYADGIIPRREALRRLALLGVGAATATSMLAACDTGGSSTGGGQPASSAPTAGGSAPAGSNVLVTQQIITFAGPEGRTLMGAWAAAVGTAQGSVLVIHENRGLTDHIRSVASRLAASGRRRRVREIEGLWLGSEEDYNCTSPSLQQRRSRLDWKTSWAKARERGPVNPSRFAFPLGGLG